MCASPFVAPALSGVMVSVPHAHSQIHRNGFSQFCVEELDRPAKNHDFNPIQPWPD